MELHMKIQVAGATGSKFSNSAAAKKGSETDSHPRPQEEVTARSGPESAWKSGLRRASLHFLSWCACFSSNGISDAEESLPAHLPIAEVIDHYLDAKLAAAGVTPASQTNDATLVRRLTLDLEGRTPTVEEVQTYVASQDSQKRAHLIERLMSSPFYARHAATELNTMLKGPDATGPDLRDKYLLVARRENRPWDRVFRELMGVTPAAHEPERFISKRISNLDVLTRDVSAIFFGINVTCCQCHTHPYIDTLTQDYFHGMKGFFTRSYEFHGKLFEKTFGPKISYDDQEVGLMFLTGAQIDTPELETDDLGKSIQEENKRIEEMRKTFSEAEKVKSESLALAEQKEKEKQKILADLDTAPEKAGLAQTLAAEIAAAEAKAQQAELIYPVNASYSYRGQLADIALRPENEQLFARSIVNRLWQRFFGYGLVMRIDQMHDDNPGSHPLLLNWLKRDMKAHGYDLNRLVEGIVKSRAYSRSSEWDPNDLHPPDKECFAVANLRPLTPMQYGVSILLCGDHQFPAAEQDFEETMNRIEQTAREKFGEIIQQPKDDLEIAADEALGLSNDVARLELIGAKLVPELRKIEDRNEQITQAVWSVLSRAPTAEEQQVLGDYLEQHVNRDDARIDEVLQQIVWALTTSAEFRFNH